MRSSPRPSAPPDPDQFDLRLNSHSRLNLIQALIQAIKAGADEALMLDPRGFVASCNSTNFFIVRGRELWTSTSLYSFKGITQANVIDAWRAAGNVAQGMRLHPGAGLFGRRGLRDRHPGRRHAGDQDRRPPDRGRHTGAKVTKEASDLYLKSVGAL